MALWPDPNMPWGLRKVDLIITACLIIFLLEEKKIKEFP